jgi:hypothetical protein
MEYCICHHKQDDHRLGSGVCAGKYYGESCFCKSFELPETGHFTGDGCKSYHGKAIERLPVAFIRAKFQNSLELQDHGIPMDYGGTRWHKTSSAFESQQWLEKNLVAVLYSLIYQEEKDGNN